MSNSSFVLTVGEKQWGNCTEEPDGRLVKRLITLLCVYRKPYSFSMWAVKGMSEETKQTLKWP